MRTGEDRNGGLDDDAAAAAASAAGTVVLVDWDVGNDFVGEGIHVCLEGRGFTDDSVNWWITSTCKVFIQIVTDALRFTSNTLLPVLPDGRSCYTISGQEYTTAQRFIVRYNNKH